MMLQEILLVLFVVLIVLVLMLGSSNGLVRARADLHADEHVYYENPVHDIGVNAPKSILRLSGNPKKKKHIQFAEKRDEIVYSKKTNKVVARLSPHV